MPALPRVPCRWPSEAVCFPSCPGPSTRHGTVHQREAASYPICHSFGSVPGDGFGRDVPRVPAAQVVGEEQEVHEVVSRPPFADPPVFLSEAVQQFAGGV